MNCKFFGILACNSNVLNIIYSHIMRFTKKKYMSKFLSTKKTFFYRKPFKPCNNLQFQIRLQWHLPKNKTPTTSTNKIFNGIFMLLANQNLFFQSIKCGRHINSAFLHLKKKKLSLNY